MQYRIANLTQNNKAYAQDAETVIEIESILTENYFSENERIRQVDIGERRLGGLHAR